MPAVRAATTNCSTHRYISWNITIETPQIAGNGRGGLFLHAAKEGQDLPAERRYARPAAALASRRGIHDALAVVPVERLDQLPGPPVRHAHRARRARDRAGLGDALNELRLARSHRGRALAENAQSEPAVSPFLSSRHLLRRIREEELLASDLVGGDRLLPFIGDDPVDECLSHVALDPEMLGRIHEDDAVLVEQAFVAFDHDRELAAILERQPRAPVGEDIGVHARCGIQRRSHPGPGLAVPRALLARDINAGRLPQLELREVRAAPVAA